MASISNDDAVQLLDEAQQITGNIENTNDRDEASGEDPKEGFIAKMQKELGTPCKVSKPPMRLPLMKFHSGRLFANLTLVADYNVRDEEYDPPEPRLNLSMGDKRVWLPTESETIRLLGEYFVSVSEILQEVDFPHKEYDIEEVRKLLRSCGCVVDHGN